MTHKALLLTASLLAAAAAPAFATTAATADLYLNSFSYSVVGASGGAPTVNTGSIGTSNAGPVTTFTLPYDFHLSQGTEATPSSPVFVVEPHNTYWNAPATATIQVTFNFSYGSTTGPAYALTENVGYYALASTDTDTLTWQAGTNGTCTGTTKNDSCTYGFAISGQKFSFTLHNETDWNMAQFDGAEYLGPTSTPEPASVAVFGAALAGFGLIRRRKRA